MLLVKVICVGKLGEKFWAQAIAEYEKRLSAYCKLEIVEVAEQRLAQSPAPAEITSALAKEAQAISSKIPNGAAVCALCIEGKACASVPFAQKISDMTAQGISKICFVIGGSYGLDTAFKQRADWQLSLSQMTFPHHFARVMLLEQIYRALNLQNGGKYHK